MKAIDLTGNRYGMLVVVCSAGRRGSQSLWLCKCDCGNQATKQLGNLRNGHTVSCGCKRSTATALAKTTHGQCGTPTYKSWQSMVTRCLNPGNHKFKDYGARGISVCERWKVFEGFFADMGERPEGTTLGRIDNDGNYEPGNCAWQNPVDQGRNKRNTKTFLHQGILATVPEHCERLGLKASTVRSRIYTYGWPIEKAFSN